VAQKPPDMTVLLLNIEYQVTFATPFILICGLFNDKTCA